MDRNYCLHCGSTTEFYGTASLSSSGKYSSCSKEVCVFCFEVGCSSFGDIGCSGNRLAFPAQEVHDNCVHDKSV